MRIKVDVVKEPMESIILMDLLHRTQMSNPRIFIHLRLVTAFQLLASPSVGLPQRIDCELMRMSEQSVGLATQVATSVVAQKNINTTIINQSVILSLLL